MKKTEDNLKPLTKGMFDEQIDAIETFIKHGIDLC